jgi:hypothetical protein
MMYPYARLMRVQSRISGKHIVSTTTQFELWNMYMPNAQSRSKSPGVLFAGASIRSECVGFYLFPLYVDPLLKDKIPEGLAQLLHGTSAFHITELTDQLKIEIFKMLEIGIKCYQEKGWL